jgi:hypothetical protein
MEPARKFKIIVNSKECGTCSGLTPSAVAKKVVKKLCGSSSKAVRFSLKECKRGCERVCGTYQGRMEKLDKPYKRDGKKITHRVVCGKVRKMRGGALGVKKFKKSEAGDDFKFDTDFFKPVIFFGDIKGKERDEEDEKTYYEFAIFNKEHRGGPVGILQLVKNNDNILEVKLDIERIFDEIAEQNNAAQNNNAAAQNNNAAEQHNAAAQNNNSAQNKLKKELKQELKKLYEFLKEDKTKYKRIRGFICYILKIDENNNIPEIFKNSIPITCPDGFDYIPYVAYKEQIKDFNENNFYEYLSQKKIEMFRSEGKKRIVELSIPNIVADSSKPDFNFKNKVFAYRMFRPENKNKNSPVKNYSVYLSVSKDNYFTVLFKYNDVIYIGIVYKKNDNNVVIFYPILEEYNSRPELDLIYSVYYYFFIILNDTILMVNFYLGEKDRYVLTKFYYDYISSFLDKETYNKIVKAILSTWTDSKIPNIMTENQETNILHILNILEELYKKKQIRNQTYKNFISKQLSLNYKRPTNQ